MFVHTMTNYTFMLVHIITLDLLIFYKKKYINFKFKKTLKLDLRFYLSKIQDFSKQNMIFGVKIIY